MFLHVWANAMMLWQLSIREHGIQLEKWIGPITTCVLFLTHILMTM